jgi:NitT/TauT family transport system substrate-binding protein
LPEEDRKLIEKHAQAAGLGDPKTTWDTLTDGTVINDGLLSGNIHIAYGGIGTFVVL